MTHLREPHVPGWLRRRTWLVGVLRHIGGAGRRHVRRCPGQSAPRCPISTRAACRRWCWRPSTRAGTRPLYSASDSRWGASGTLVEGDVNLDDDTSITRVMLPNSDGSLLRFNDSDGDNGGLVLRDFFGQTGAGADLTVWVQTSSGTASFAASDTDTVGKNYVNFNVPASRTRCPERHRHGRPVPAGAHEARAHTPATGDRRSLDGAGRPDPDRRHQRHLRRRGPGQRGLRLSVARRRCEPPAPLRAPSP